MKKIIEFRLDLLERFWYQKSWSLFLVNIWGNINVGDDFKDFWNFIWKTDSYKSTPKDVSHLIETKGPEGPKLKPMLFFFLDND